MPWGARSQRCRTGQEQAAAELRSTGLARRGASRARLPAGGNHSSRGMASCLLMLPPCSVPSWHAVPRAQQEEDQERGRLTLQGASQADSCPRARLGLRTGTTQGPCQIPRHGKGLSSFLLLPRAGTAWRGTHTVLRCTVPLQHDPKHSHPLFAGTHPGRRAQLTRRIKNCFQVPASRLSRDHPAAQTQICATDG